MINCTPKPVKRGAIQFNLKNLGEIVELIGMSNLDDHVGQSLVNTKRHGWQNVSIGDYLIFDEDNRLLKVLNVEDFLTNYSIHNETSK